MRWLSLWAAATIPPTAIRFFRIFLAQPSIGGPKRGPRVTLAWTLLAYAGARRLGDLASRSTSTTYFLVPFGVYVFGGLYRCVWDLYTQYRATTKRVERTRVGYLALGGFVATTLTLTDVLPRFGIAWPAIGNVLGILYLYFLSQTLFRNRLLDLNELVGKMAVLGTLVVLLSAVYGFLLYWIGSGQQGLYLLNALVAAFVILILFEPVRSWLENGINRWLLRQRTELRGRLDAVRRELPGVVDVARHGRSGSSPRSRSRAASPMPSIYLLDADGAGFDRAGFLGKPPPERLDANAERALLDRVRTGYLDLDQRRARARRTSAARRRRSSRRSAPRCVALRTRVDELQAPLIFPLFGSAETEQGPWLLGLFCVRDDRTDSAFDADDIDTFRQLAIGAARVIESSQAYERVKERDRLAALGEMAAGLAHEIRNPLGAIKGAAQLLITVRRRAGVAATETAEFLDIIVEEANRLNNVVTRFLDYARAERPGREGADKVDLNSVVRKTVQLLQQEQLKNVELRVRIDEQLPHGRRRSRVAAPGVPEPRPERAAGDARRRHARDPDDAAPPLAPRLRPVLRGPVPRHRHRHPARSPEEAVHPVLHDEAKGHRPRPRDQPPHHQPARRHDRGALDDRPGLDVLGVPARRRAGAGAQGRGHHRDRPADARKPVERVAEDFSEVTPLRRAPERRRRPPSPRPTAADRVG